MDPSVPHRHYLTDEEWARLQPLPARSDPHRGGRWADHRMVLNAMFCGEPAVVSRGGRGWPGGLRPERRRSRADEHKIETLDNPADLFRPSSWEDLRPWWRRSHRCADRDQCAGHTGSGDASAGDASRSSALPSARNRPMRYSRSRRHTVNGCDLGRQRRDGHTERGRGQLTVRDVGSAGDVADHPNRRVAPRAAGRIVAGRRWVLAERTITVGEPPRRRP